MAHDFIKDSNKLLNNLPPLTGDAARVAHRLSRALSALEVVMLYCKHAKKLDETDFNQIMKEI